MAEKFLKWGIYAIVFGLPLYLIRFKIFGIPTTVLEAMIYVVFVVWLIKVFNFLELKNAIKENRLLFWAIFLILLGASLATIRSWDLKLSAGILKAWFFDPVLFFIVFISVIKREEEIRKVFYALMLSGVVVSVASLICLFLGELNIDGRLQGFYNSPNYLAMYLAPIFVVVFWFLAQTIYTKTRVDVPASHRAPSRPRLDRALGLRRVFLINNLRPTFLVLNSAFLILILFCTGSFGAWMGVAAGIGFGLIIWLWSAKKRKIALIIAILLTILCVGLYFVKFSSIQGRLSINSRLEIWQKAVNGIAVYSVIGVGPGTFKDFFPEDPDWSVPQPHNLYLAFLLQAGIVGFIGFILLLVWFFGLKANQPRADTQLLLMMIMIYVLAHGLVDTTYWKNDLAIMFWVIIGLAALKSKCFKIQSFDIDLK